MNIKVDQTKSTKGNHQVKDDVKIIWKGNRIAKLVFASGKVVEFRES